VTLNLHLVDIGDDVKGIQCHCKCGWRFESNSRQERLSESHNHVAQALQVNT